MKEKDLEMSGTEALQNARLWRAGRASAEEDAPNKYCKGFAEGTHTHAASVVHLEKVHCLLQLTQKKSRLWEETGVNLH